MKWNAKFLAILAIAAISAMTISAKMKATTGMAIGKEGTATANELVITDASMVQSANLDVMALSYAKQYTAPVDTERVATDYAAAQIQGSPTDALAHALIATSDQVAIRAAEVTDQLALKGVVANSQYAFATTGVAQLGSS